jgi:hypothetical protein
LDFRIFIFGLEDGPRLVVHDDVVFRSL